MEHTNQKFCMTPDAARGDVLDYIERHNTIRRHSILGDPSPVNFERAAADTKAA